MSLHWSIEWERTKEQSEVFLEWISHHAAIPAGHDRNVVRVLSGLLKAEYPISETPRQASTFINQFMSVKGDFPRGEFQALGWVYSSDEYWLSRMVGIALEDLKQEPIQTSPYATVRAIQCGILQSNHHFFAMLERYNPETCKLFTSVREIGFALHEIYEVSGLAIGDISYEEYVSSADELHMIEESLPWYMRCTGKCCATSTSVRRSLGWDLEGSNKWPRRTIFSTIWEIRLTDCPA